ncbi:hypothetical protein N7492_001804 [Penicillium capsulatum]|uniref:Uncharacterized protein n=1 Tax=Penicillium capsulatum TaxID=69766 RepID=A0A9W9ITX8_9EURO|nr:hypothetical protein N7492_001804 [Penicillium capsulatum]KAJ6129146.1 hypothetical protein N7512_001926 [Penicillium capsulatum]
MDILSALEALRNASPEVLQNHRHETTEALQKIEARLRELDPPEPSSTEQPTSTGQAEMEPSRPAILLAALHTVSSWVWKSANSPPRNILQIKRRRIRDRRLDDIRRIEGDRKIERNPKASPEYKIIRVLAQRSLALQGEKSKYLDIDSYCKIASSRKPGKTNRGRQGKIAAFVRTELDVEDEDKDFSIRAISAGIKQLVTERLLEKRLEETGQCNSASGISAFTALLIRPFRSLTYTEIPEFLDDLLEKDTMDLPNLMENDDTECFLPVSTAKVIRVSSAWFDKLQTYYDQSSSSNIDENGSIHCRPTSPQESLDSLSEVLEHPQSNISSSPYSTGPETPRFTGCGLDDQNHTRHFDPSSQQRRHLNPSTNLIRSRSPLYNCGSRSNIENAISDIPSDPQHATHQAHGPSIQPYVDASNTQDLFDPWPIAHATRQAHSPPIQPYTDASNTQDPFDPWPIAHATRQAHNPSIQPYVNNTQDPVDPWPIAHATRQAHSPPIQPYTDGSNTQDPFDPWPIAHATRQAHGTPIQPYADASNTQDLFDPWPIAHATRQAHGTPIQPYADASNTQDPFDPWPIAHATRQAHGTPIQPYADASNTQDLFDPWPIAHATRQAHGTPIQPYADASNTQDLFDPWPIAHATRQVHNPSIQPYVNNTQDPVDPWPIAHATPQINDSALAPYASTDDAQIPLHSSQPVSCQVDQYPVRTALPLYRNMTAQRDLTATQFSTPVRLALQAAW